MHIGHFLKFCITFVSFLCLYACQTDTVYYTYQPIPVDGWSKTDTLHYYLPDTLSSGNYQLEVGIRHSGKYPYRDIWLELTQYVPNATTTNEWIERKDTIHIYLANENGNWNGTGTTGGHFQLLSPIGDITIADQHTSAEKDELEVTEKMMQDNGISTNQQPKLKVPKKKYTFEGKPHTLGKAANHHLEIIHIMTDSLLLHISDIGLRLSR